MARQYQQEFGRRAQVDQRQSFDYTTPRLDVTARTTDPMVSQPQAGGNWAKLSQALGVAQPMLQAYSQQKTEDDLKSGRIDALLGNEKPSKGLAKIKGFEQLQGEITATRDYKAQVDQFFNDNHKVMSAKEFEEGLQGIAKGFLEGATDFFIEGFAPNASEIEAQIFERYTKAQQTMFQQEAVSLLGTKAYDGALSFTENLLSQYFNVDSLDALKYRPDIHETLANGNFKSLFAPAMRQALTIAQNQGKEIGLSRHEVSSIYLEQVGRMAVKYGLPELLAFAYEPDESGIALARGVQGSAIHRDKDAAVKAQQSIVDALHKDKQAHASALTKAQQDELKQQQDLLLNKTNLQIRSMEAASSRDPVQSAAEASNLLDTLLNDSSFWSLPPSTFDSVVSKLIDIESKDGHFVDKSDGATIDNLFTPAILGGTLKLEDITQAREDRLLSRADYLSLLKDYRKQEDDNEAEVTRLASEFAKAEELRLQGDIEEAIDTFRRFTNPAVERVIRTGTPAGALALLTSLENSPTFLQIPMEEYNAIYRKLLDHIAKDTTFKDESVGSIISDLVRRRERGTLTLEDIEAQQSNLSRQDWEDLIKAYTKQEAEAQARETARLAKLDEEATKAQADTERQVKESFIRDTNTAISNLEMLGQSEKVSQALQLREEFLSSEIELPPSEHKRILDDITKVAIENIDFPSQGVDALYVKLFTKGKSIDEQLTLDEIMQAIDNQQLTVSQATSLLTLQGTQAREFRTRQENLDAETKRYEEKAEQARIQEELAADRKTEEEFKEARAQTINQQWSQIMHVIRDSTDREGDARDLIDDIEEASAHFKYPESTHTAMLRELNNVISDARKPPERGNFETYTSLRNSAVMYDLDIAEVFAEADNHQLSESQLDKLISAWERQQQAIEQGLNEWPDVTPTEINRLRTNIIQGIVGLDPLTGFIPAERLTQASTLENQFIEGLLDFRDRNEGRNPSYGQWINEIVKPIADMHGHSLRDLLGNTGTTSEPTISIEGTRTPMTKVDPDKVVGKGLNAFQKALNYLPFINIKPTQEKDPSWAIPAEARGADEEPDNRTSAERGYDYYSTSLGLGATKELVEDISRSGLGLNDDAIRFYSQNYANIYATEMFLENQYSTRTVIEIRQTLESQGFSEQEIITAINAARHADTMRRKEGEQTR